MRLIGLREKAESALWILILMLSPVASASASEKGWMLEQVNTYAPAGQWNVILSEKGIKAGDGTFALVFAAPNFDAVMENDKTKQYTLLTRKEWVRTFVKGGTSWKDDDKQPRTLKLGTKSGHIAGFHVQQYIQSEFGSPSKEVWITSDIKLPKKNCTVLNQLCDAPHCQGVPLRVVRLNGHGKKEVLLNTLEAKQISVADSTFTPPKGYKREKTTTALLLTVGQGKEFSDMLTEQERHE